MVAPLVMLKDLIVAQGWIVQSLQGGIYSISNELTPGVAQIVSLWSTKSGAVDSSGADVVQIELRVRLHYLERFIEEHLGSGYANEFGKTVGIFLHRLIADGKKYSQGFELNSQARGGDRSCGGVFKLIEAHGFPFMCRVASGRTLLDGSGITPILVDPLNWEVRRLIAELTSDSTVSLPDAANKARSRLKIGLEEKFSKMAKINSGINVMKEVAAREEKFTYCIQVLSGKTMELSLLRQKWRISS
jgi:hypothetical protein